MNQHVIVKEPKWVTVATPGKKPRAKGGLKAGQKAKKTQVYEDRLLAIFKNPPEDFDGTNKHLAELTQVSVRTVARVLASMKKDGKIQIHRKVHPTKPGSYYTDRFIQIQDGTI